VPSGTLLALRFALYLKDNETTDDLHFLCSVNRLKIPSEDAVENFTASKQSERLRGVKSRSLPDRFHFSEQNASAIGAIKEG